MSCAHLQLWYNKTKDAWTICTPLYSISSVIIGHKLEYEWKVDSNQLFFNYLSMSTQLWAALINTNSYQLNCEMLLSISMSTSIVPILAYQLFLINALNISDVLYILFSAELKPRGYYLEHVFNLDHVILQTWAMCIIWIDRFL